MNLVELNAIKTHLKKQLKDIESIQVTCLRCEHLQSGHKCKKFDAQPPSEWLHSPVDCEHWKWDCVPF
jgi:hypothetical protein